VVAAIPTEESMSQPHRAAHTPLRPSEKLLAHSLYLQPPTLGDMDFVRWLWADAATMQAVGGPIVLTDEEARQWYARMVDPGRNTDCYCLIRLLDDSPVGEISFHRLHIESMTAELNVKVMASMRGRGIAREALLRFLDYYFNSFGGRVLVDNLAPQNSAGQLALAKLGFRQVPSPGDVVRYEMRDQEFRNLVQDTGGAISG